MNTIESGTYKIRPAGCLLQTIGSNLIQDIYAAVIELVKNAYDADSPDVTISFLKKTDNDTYSVCIEDHGHGMSRNVVIKKWLVPSTNDKLIRKTSPRGRVMQGRKGVGRFASAILGDDLLLETITPNGEKTTAYIQWDLFTSAEYLDDVEILIETTHVSAPAGTKLTISGTKIFAEQWDDKQFNELIFELKKLKSPIPVNQIRKNAFPIFPTESNSKDEDVFDIFLTVTGFSESRDVENLEITPFPLFDLFDYRISGFVNASGNGELTYSMQKIKNASNDKINFCLPHETNCGNLYFDIRVYDRDKDAIDMLIKRGLTDECGNFMGKLEARRLLDRSNGIGVYRNGFRIRPLGDPGFDWLTLNASRVQEPARKIGCNQVIGCVFIESEEKSGLIENSARDGLKTNAAYEALKEVTHQVIQVLETRRYIYRKKAGLSRPVLKIERDFEKLFSFSDIKVRIRRKLKQRGVSDAATNEIIDILSESEAEKNKVADDIRMTVAIYQGQATLGKIINAVLHEGRKPLNYFKNQIPNLVYWTKSFLRSGDKGILDKLSPIISGVEENTSILAGLFSKLDPLAAGRRSSKKEICLPAEIKKCVSVFNSALTNAGITVVVNGGDDFKYLAWAQDIYAIFTNLIENSIYWIGQAKKEKKEIRIEIVVSNGVLQQIDYFDSGTGIEKGLIESKVIFEPDFSTKPNGTGLGLAIAGEAAERNNLQLSALDYDGGVHFCLEPILSQEGE